MAGGEIGRELDAVTKPILTAREAAIAEAAHWDNDKPRTPGGPPRELPEAVIADIAASVGSMLARGWDPRVIRRSLKLSRRQYDRVIRELLADADDCLTIFAKAKAAIASDLRQFANMRERALAMTPPALIAAIRATSEMGAARHRLITIGQSLGYFRSVQPEARATLDDQDARRELPNLEGSEADDAAA